MRSALAAGCLLAAGVAALAGATGQERSDQRASGVEDATAVSPVDASGRIHLGVAEREAAGPAGFLPAHTKSILQVSHQMAYGEYIWDDAVAPTGEIEIVVDLRTQIISVFRAGHEIGTAVVVYGADGHDTPLGTHPVLSKVRDYRSIAYDAPMPFTVWLTNDGVAIHASDVRRGRATHGCIGVPREFAEHLFRVVDVGDTVRVVRSQPRSSLVANS